MFTDLVVGSDVGRGPRRSPASAVCTRKARLAHPAIPDDVFGQRAEATR